ncbi:MAG: hydrolase [Chlamydiales bacterium]
MQTYTPYLEWIKTQQNRFQNHVKKWSKINSYSTYLPGLAELTRALKEDFACLGGDVQLIPLPPRQIVDDLGNIANDQLGSAILFKKRPLAPLQIFLAGHMDTVFPPTSPFQNVEEISPAVWQGPGVTDMKGGLAIMLIALEALERAPFAEKIGWEILINPDEEIGSPGSGSLFEAAAQRNHLGMIFEPSFPDGAFVSERKGSANYTAIVRGKAAHAGRDFTQGRSAIYALAELIHKIEAMQLADPDLIINIGRIEGGGPTNIVPDLAIAKINVRSSKEEAMQNSLIELKKIAALVQCREGIRIHLVSETIRFPKPFNHQVQQLFSHYADCAKQLNVPFSLRATGGVCDGNILAHAGLPVLDSLGAIGGNLHTHQEYLLLPSLVERGQLAALFLLKLASGEIALTQELFRV